MLTYNSANQIGSYSYDGAGNLTSDPAGSNGTQVLSDASVTGITYGIAGQTGQPWIQSYTSAASASSSPVYVLHDQQGTPLGYTQDGSDYAYVTDNIGSVTSIIAQNGGTAATYAYDPYGNTTSQTGPQASTSLFGPHTAYTGYIHDGNRWYNPATGAFTTQDTNSYLANPPMATATPTAPATPPTTPTPPACSALPKSQMASACLAGNW